MTQKTGKTVLATAESVLKFYSTDKVNQQENAKKYFDAVRLRREFGFGSRSISRMIGAPERAINYWFSRGEPKSVKGLQELERAGLLPLVISENASFTQFVRTLGLRYADGCIYEQKRNNSLTFHICFGDKIDALTLIEDAHNAWGIKLNYCFASNAYCVYFPASIARLFICVGSPFGRKTSQSFSLPNWIYSLPERLQLEFVGGLFSGDGSVPKLKPIGTCSESLKLSLNAEKHVAKQFSNEFMFDIHILLKKLGIQSTLPVVKRVGPRISKEGVTTYPVEIRILTERKNMAAFLSKVPFRCCSRAAIGAKKVLAGLQWVKQKQLLCDYFNVAATDAPRFSILLEPIFQGKLVVDAAKTFASPTKKQLDGRYTNLAEHLQINCQNFKGD